MSISKKSDIDSRDARHFRAVQLQPEHCLQSPSLKVAETENTFRILTKSSISSNRIDLIFK
jgi:hypothetical protein